MRFARLFGTKVRFGFLSVWILAALLLLVGACTAAPVALTPTNTPTTSTTPTSTSAQYTVNVASSASLGDYLVDSKGMTLYFTQKDSVGMSNVVGTTLQTWPVFNTTNVVVPSTLSASDFGAIIRNDGAMQTTYKGWPLYYYASDKADGDTMGQGIGGVWFVVNPSNFPLTPITPLPTATNSPIPTTTTTAPTSGSLTSQEQLGKYLFYDMNLSDPAGQACADCHGTTVGYTGPDQAINAAGAVYEGAVAGRFGNRKPPSAAYAGDSPILHYDGTTWVGGMFWDGRATGDRLGDPLAEQAQGPFLNPLEQNNASSQVVINKVLASSYSDLFSEVVTGKTPTEQYDGIGRAIAAYERSTEVSSFTSKYDYWLKGQANLTGQEQLGLNLFNGKAQCANCHVAPLFTNYTYDNLGVPKNPENPFYDEPAWNPLGADFVDNGLGGFLKSVGDTEAVWGSEIGKQKVPTLRNVDLRPTESFIKAYSHNGYFKSLEEIVHFYNTRDVAGSGWPASEVSVNINTVEVGNLKLNHEEELAIVAFLKTLSDGYIPKN